MDNTEVSMPKSLETLVNELGGVLKTIRKLHKYNKYHTSNFYRWKERGYIPPRWWKLIIQLTNGRVTLEELFEEFAAMNPL